MRMKSSGPTLASLGGQPLDADLTAIAALTSAANKLPYATGAGTWSLTDLSAFARTFLDDADAAAVQTTLGISGATNLTAANIATVSDGNTIGGIPDVHIMVVGGGGNTDLVLTHKFLLKFFVIEKHGNGSSGDSLVITNPATSDITGSIDLNVTNQTILLPTTINYNEALIQAGGTLRITATEAGNAACHVTLFGVRRS